MTVAFQRCRYKVEKGDSYNHTCITLLISWRNIFFFSGIKNGTWLFTTVSAYQQNLHIAIRLAFLNPESYLTNEAHLTATLVPYSVIFISLLMCFIMFKISSLSGKHVNYHIYSIRREVANKKKYLLHKKFPKRQESMQSKKSTRKSWIIKH